MTICRYYLMSAKDAKCDDLREALSVLAAQVRAVGGCEGVEVLQDLKLRTQFHFIERWSSIDAHRAAGQLLGKQAFEPILASVAEPPTGAYLEPVSLAS